jgi:cytochrome c oxidase assembly protein subunit 15
MRPPAVSPRTFHRLAVVAAVAMGAIVVSGAAVRLTGSGLGCPTWPRCTENSIVAPVSYHALVEFVNRVVTSVVGVFVAIVAVSALLRRPRRRDLTWLAWSLVGGFLGQALVGGLSVLYDLSPPWVMAHFLLSMLMVWAALVLVHRAHPDWVPTPPVVRRELLLLGRVLVVTAGVVLTLGTVTTGTGPHAGDGTHHVARLGFPLERVTQLHADAALLLTGLVVATLFTVRLTDTTPVVRRRAAWLAAAVGVQVVIGYTQYFLDLPAGIVELHVAGATLLWAATLWLQLSFSLDGSPHLPGKQRSGEQKRRPHRGTAGVMTRLQSSHELAHRERTEQQRQIADGQMEQRHRPGHLAAADPVVQPVCREQEHGTETDRRDAVEPAGAERQQQQRDADHGP